MERSAVRKRLRHMQRLLINSRWELEKASSVVRNKWMKDLLSMLACRRVIMLNLLDRELGTFGVATKPSKGVVEHFDHLESLPGSTEPMPDNAFMSACEMEESHVRNELQDLMYQPGLAGRTRQMIADLLGEVSENLNDLRFMKAPPISLQA